MKQVHKMRFLFTIFATLVFLSVNFLLCASQSVIASGNETDRFALLAFKDRITSDPFGVLTSWNDSSHYCTWIGVLCIRRHPSRVTVLNLRAMSLTGSIYPHIGNLTFLQNLRLSNNSFNGEIPQEVGRLFRLQFLYLTNNSLQGEIPNNLTGKIVCTKLIYLFLTGNQLTGKLPTQLGSLYKLVVNIPPEIGKLSRLEFFQVSGNNLSGTIPAQLFNISSIYLFAVTGNQLHISVPPNVGNALPNLRSLAVGGNLFSGSLPTSISNVSGLSQLEFSRNQFTGHVPPNLGSLQDLVRLILGENQLGTGEADDLNFLSSLSNCSHLEVLALTGNNLSGQLPDSIANLSTKLTKLYMGGNRIFIFGKIV
ncbi:putative receptor-like protein kinase At3g47110 [Papaver somniferum]|uniref:putative receptor-like protein kinase At3g47110 n=1 Tax=Papaver somniferum TaxID=3469 RepID=UPI000E6FDD80|nr:putative receptor-like protein kinase At3g47110 [Papaver somniferum]